MFVTLESQFCTTRFRYAELIKRILNFLISNLITNTKVNYRILDSAFYLVKEHPGCKNQKPTHLLCEHVLVSNSLTRLNQRH